jgi:hypothetical protein
MSDRLEQRWRLLDRQELQRVAGVIVVARSTMTKFAAGAYCFD